MINYQFTLDYSLGAGWMAPFIEALTSARAMATQCLACKRVSFPPVRYCSCGEPMQDWIELTGTAELVYQCDGIDGKFALVRFVGADTMSVVKLEGFNEQGGCGGNMSGRLMPASDDLPALILGPAT